MIEVILFYALLAPDETPNVNSPEAAAEIILTCLQGGDLERCMWAGYEQCSGGQTGWRVVGPCERAVGDGWDYLLNQYYREVRNRYSELSESEADAVYRNEYWARRSEDLLEAQRAWIRFRDHDCESERTDAASVHGSLDVSHCKYELTASRVIELQNRALSLARISDDLPAERGDVEGDALKEDSRFGENVAICSVNQAFMDNGARPPQSLEAVTISQEARTLDAYAVQTMNAWMLYAERNPRAARSDENTTTLAVISFDEDREYTFNAGVWYEKVLSYQRQHLHDEASEVGALNVAAQREFENDRCGFVLELVQQEVDRVPR